MLSWEDLESVVETQVLAEFCHRVFGGRFSGALACRSKGSSGNPWLGGCIFQSEQEGIGAPIGVSLDHKQHKAQSQRKLPTRVAWGAHRL